MTTIALEPDLPLSLSDEPTFEGLVSSESGKTSSTLALRFLRKFARRRSPVKLVYRGLCEIRATSNVVRLEPAPFPPAPAGARRHANLFQPFGQTDDRARSV